MRQPVAVHVFDPATREWFVIDSALFACFRCGDSLDNYRFADVPDEDGLLVRVCPSCVTTADRAAARGASRSRAT